MAAENLSMVRLELEAAGLARIETLQRLPPIHGDLGYAVHAALAGLFGEAVLQPFRTRQGTRRGVSVLAYSSYDADNLRSRAESFADPAFHAACRWDGLATKWMPPSWETGARLGFEVRLCPVVRLSSDIEAATREGGTVRFRRGAEIDAWVHSRWVRRESGAADKGREGVYRDWLEKRLAPAARVLSARLEGFRRLRLVRKDHARKRTARVFDRPDALFSGDLEIQDGAAFHELLVRGVGRHCAYGFGMILLRPPR